MLRVGWGSLRVLTELRLSALGPLRSPDGAPAVQGCPDRSARLGPRTWVESKESSPNTNTAYQPNIKSRPNIDIPRI